MQNVMQPLYPEPEQNPGDTKFDRFATDIVRAAIGLMFLATVIGLPVMAILNAIAG